MSIWNRQARVFAPGRGRRVGGAGRDHRQRGDPGGARRSGQGVDTAAAPLAGPDAAGRTVPGSLNTTPPCRTFPVGGLPPPRLDNFDATCRRHLPLPPCQCNLLQSRHVRPPGTSPTPPARRAIQVRLPATAALLRSPSGRGKMTRTMSKGVNRAVPVVSPSSQKGIPHTYGVCVQQVERLRNVAGFCGGVNCRCGPSLAPRGSGLRPVQTAPGLTFRTAPSIMIQYGS